MKLATVQIFLHSVVPPTTKPRIAPCESRLLGAKPGISGDQAGHCLGLLGPVKCLLLLNNGNMEPDWAKSSKMKLNGLTCKFVLLAGSPAKIYIFFSSDGIKHCLGFA